MFLIFAVGKANGGHYRSLIAIAEELSKNYKIIIINLGYTYSPIISKSGLETYFVFFNGINVLHTLNKITKTFNIYSIDYIHCFDYLSLLIGRLLSKIIHQPYIFTKCGGPSPTGYYPFSKFMTVFSTEDYLYFTNKKKYINSVIYHIPNRVNVFKSNTEKIKFLRIKYNLTNKLIFLRICRISEYYYSSIKQSIDLINELSIGYPQVVLLIIGNIQNRTLFNKINEELQKNNSVIFITDDELTINAKELINISHFVIGTGRGFMEACSKSKVLLTPAKNSKYPILININNFQNAFDKNFSERIIFNKSDIEENLININRLIEFPYEYKIACDSSYNWFIKHFSVENAKNIYIQVYKNSYYCNDNLVDLVLHFVLVSRKNIGNTLKFYLNKFRSKF